MKNLLKNKKGFSLAEILLVVAIVAILSGATMIGIASMVNRSQAAASKAVSDNANFEADAVLKVEQKKGTVANIPYETETLETGSTDGSSGGGETNGNQNNNNSNSGNQNSGDVISGGGNTNSSSSESSSEDTTASTSAGANNPQGGGTTNPLTSPFSMTSSGSKTIEADPSKKLKKVVIEWENNNQESWGMAHSQFVVTYNNSKGGNYNNKNNTIGGQGTSNTATIDVGVEGCSGINIKYESGKFTIKSITYVYE